MGRYGSLEYERLTKYDFLLGVGLLVIGGGGELIGHALFGQLPSLESTLFFDLEVAGTAMMLIVPFVLGIALPLTE